MPRAKGAPILNLRQEAFCRNVAVGDGRSIRQCYVDAGYVETKCPSQAASRMLRLPQVQRHINDLIRQAAEDNDELTRVAIEITGISKDKVAVELAKLGFSNMADYIDIDEAGTPVFNLSRMTRAQSAAIASLTIEEYVQGRGENAREVKRYKFSLHDKRQALMDIARLFGWLVERHENKVVDEFEHMSEAELEAWLDERAAIRAREKPLREKMN